jgi:hypothetical protein
MNQKPLTMMGHAIWTHHTQTGIQDPDSIRSIWEDFIGPSVVELFPVPSDDTCRGSIFSVCLTAMNEDKRKAHPSMNTAVPFAGGF